MKDQIKMNFTKDSVKDIDSVDYEKINRLISWAKGDEQYPIEAEIIPTWKCNLRCVYCSQRNPHRDTDEEISTKDWLNIIKQLGKAKVKRITISGGEPLCKKGIKLILKTIKEQKMEGLLITNGTLFDEELIKMLFDIGWDSIAFSLESHKAKTHDALRGKGSFKKIIKTIKLFNKIKKERFTKPYISITSTLTKKNYKDIPKLVKLAKKLKLVKSNILPLIVHHEEGGKLLIDPKDRKKLQKYLKKAHNLSEDDSKYTYINDVSEEDINEIKNAYKLSKKDCSSKVDFKSDCFNPFLIIPILPDGSIKPCSAVESKIGKLIKNKSLKSVWFGKEITEFRKKLLKNKNPFQCSKCPRSSQGHEALYFQNKINESFENE